MTNRALSLKSCAELCPLRHYSPKRGCESSCLRHGTLVVLHACSLPVVFALEAQLESLFAFSGKLFEALETGREVFSLAVTALGVTV